MDIDHIKNRVLEFLRSENLTSAQFAEEIGVQPSGISHIISGRNKPSLDFIVKMLSRYPSLSTDWLLLGKGSMFRDGNEIDLFSGSINPAGQGGKKDEEKTRAAGENLYKTNVRSSEMTNEKPKTSRIVIFHSDGTFTEHFPE